MSDRLKSADIKRRLIKLGIVAIAVAALPFAFRLGANINNIPAIIVGELELLMNPIDFKSNCLQRQHPESVCTKEVDAQPLYQAMRDVGVMTNADPSISARSKSQILAILKEFTNLKNEGKIKILAKRVDGSATPYTRPNGFIDILPPFFINQTVVLVNL